jgi:hypothetical protein
MHRSKTFLTGLVIAGLLGVADLTAIPTSDGQHPPLPVGIADTILGVLTLVGVYYAWRGRRGGVTTVIVTRLLSAVSAVPAFFADGVPAGAMVAAGVGIAITLLAVALIAPQLRRAPVPVAAA